MEMKICISELQSLIHEEVSDEEKKTRETVEYLTGQDAKFKSGERSTSRLRTTSLG